MPKSLSNERIDCPHPPDPRFPPEAQFDLVVEGSSLDKLANEGDLIRCVDIERGRVEIRNGDIVIVERTKGDARELLGKRVLKQCEQVELWSESNHEFWREPVIRNEGESGTRIVAKVLYAYRKR